MNRDELAIDIGTDRKLIFNETHRKATCEINNTKADIYVAWLWDCNQIVQSKTIDGCVNRLSTIMVDLSDARIASYAIELKKNIVILRPEIAELYKVKSCESTPIIFKLE
ncbi:MAG: hypothetical protein ACYCPT_06985 [Acidimicrobiales bacterium]